MALGIISFLGSVVIGASILYGHVLIFPLDVLLVSLFISFIIVPAIAVGIGIYAISACKKNPNYEGKSFAIIGIVLGSIQLGGALAFIALMPFSCCCCCLWASSESSKGFLPFLAIPACRKKTIKRIFRELTWDLALSHHPNEKIFENDVYFIGNRRLCVGCFTTYPAFIMGLISIYIIHAKIDWVILIAIGFSAALAQTFSSLGMARTRGSKAAVKALLGVGLAAVVVGTMVGPWPLWGKGLFLSGVLLAASGSAVPRAMRLRRFQQAGA